MDWKSRAEAALAAGYVRRTHGAMFHVHLLRNYPDLVREFQVKRRCLAHYIIVRTNNAMNRADQLEREGTPPETAKELALAELLQAPPENPKAWEAEERSRTSWRRCRSISTVSRRKPRRRQPDRRKRGQLPLRGSGFYEGRPLPPL